METAMQIEAGKFYKTRDGRKVGPVTIDHVRLWPAFVVGLIHEDEWRLDGTWAGEVREDENDIVAEWVEPLRIVAGGVYRTAGDHKVGPMASFDCGRFKNEFIHESGDGCVWRSDGSLRVSCGASYAQDIVAEWIEPKPAFKPGDRVKFLSETRTAPRGTIAAVGPRAVNFSSICDQDMVDIVWQAGVEQNNGNYFLRNFEPAPLATFAVGDVVKVVSDRYRAVGKHSYGDVRAGRGDGTYSVRMADGGLSYVYPADEIELTTDPVILYAPQPGQSASSRALPASLRNAMHDAVLELARRGGPYDNVLPADDQPEYVATIMRALETEGVS
jgi:hypothetical protein